MPPITPDLVLFVGLAGLAGLAAVGVVAFDNAIRSALCLVLNFFLLAVLYFTLGSEMLGITQIVVYTGAIMVLFLFVIMLLNLGVPQLLKERLDPKKPVAALLGGVLIVVVGAQILPELAGVSHPGALVGAGGPQAIGRALFTDYVVPFEAVSVLLLVGIVGSILLAKRRLD